MPHAGAQARFAVTASRPLLDAYAFPDSGIAELSWGLGQGLVGGSAAGLVPALADVPTRENGGINNDASVFTYRLRKGARWHDGKPVEASDVRAAFERLMSSNPLWHVLPPYDNVRAVIPIDRERCRVELRTPDPAFASRFFAAAGVLPLPLLRGSSAAPIGTGPYAFAFADPAGCRLHAVRAARISQIDFRFVTSSQSAAVALRSGEVDGVVPIDRTVANAWSLPVVARRSGCVFIVANAAHLNAAQRRALLGAIDVDAIRKRIYRVDRTDLLLPGVAVHLRPPTGRLPSDVTLAYVMSDAQRQAAEVLQQQLERSHVRVTMEGHPYAVYQRMLREGRYDIAIWGGQYANLDDARPEFACVDGKPGPLNISHECDPGLVDAFARFDAAAVGDALSRDGILRLLAPYEDLAAFSPRVRLPLPRAPFVPWFADLAQWSIG